MKNRRITLLIFVVLVLLFGIFKLFLSNQAPSSASLDPDQFEAKTKEPGVVILDVRSAFEFGGDKIQGARNISYTAPDFKSNIEKLDKNSIYLVYCLSGSRSAGALNTMKSLGFTNVYHLKGGIENWKAAGKPITK
jgi:rhodanese-related sulfurtransferase